MKRRFLLILVALVLALLCGCTQENTGRYDMEFRGERYTVDLDAGSITHKGELYLFAKEGTGDSVSYTIVYPNSARYFYNKTGMTANMSWSDGYDDERYVDGETLVDLLQEQKPQSKGSGFSVIGGILLILMGIPMILLPEVVFFISYGWMLKNAEPSDGMITYTRICGGVFILIGIVVLFL